MKPGKLGIGGQDGLCPWNDGRFELEGLPEGTECQTSSSSPDLVLGISDFASAYMGAVSFSTLARAGLAEERTPDALLRADRMFAVQYPPWTPCNF